MKNKQKIIIDCDPGIDDALAINLLVKSGMFDICTITTVAGNCTVRDATNNAGYIIKQLNVDIPIHSGAEKPLKKKLVTAKVHGDGGLAGIKVQKDRSLTTDSVSRAAEIITGNPGLVTILVIGPLTNIAKLIKSYPKAAGLVREIVILGGAIEVSGNQTKYSEYNMFVDPDAAKIVLASKIKKTIIPLDVCYQTGFQISDVKPTEEFTKLILNYYQDSQKKFEKMKSIIVYDAVAAYYLINPKAFRIIKSDLAIKTSGKFRGQTRLLKQKNLNTKFATEINRASFLEDLIKILKGGE